MKIVTVVQARLSSTRLPGKVLLPLCGEPLLLKMLERLSHSKLVGKIIVATTKDKEDDAIEALCHAHKISVYRGSKYDLLDRHYQVAHLTFLQQLLNGAWRQHRRLRVWSAACSTGEEPYSIVISLLEATGGALDREIRVVATDIDTNALATATRGIYAATRVSELPAPVRQRYFLRGCGRWADHVRIKPQIASMVQFSRINLVTPFSSPGQFEAIFCRNVMIYFSQETQETLVNRLAESLEPGGYLFIGHAESLSSIRHSLRYVAPAVYQRAGMAVRR